MSKPDITLTSTVVRSPTPVAADLGQNEVALMHVDQGHYYGLNPVGSFIWSLIESPQRVSDVLEKLIEIYDVAPEKCHDEVLSYLQKLMDHDLVNVIEAAPE